MRTKTLFDFLKFYRKTYGTCMEIDRDFFISIEELFRFNLHFIFHKNEKVEPVEFVGFNEKSIRFRFKTLNSDSNHSSFQYHFSLDVFDEGTSYTKKISKLIEISSNYESAMYTTIFNKIFRNR